MEWWVFDISMWEVISHLFAIAVGIAGSYWLIFKGKLSGLRNVFSVIGDCIEDDNLTSEEVAKIWEAIKALF